MKESAQSTSIWMAGSDLLRFTPLDRNVETDVCVVGGGISGLTAAYLLAHEGVRVVLLEADAIGSGMTARSTGHLNTALDDGYLELERLHGEEGAKEAADSHMAAIDQIETIARDESIHCDFERVDGYLIGEPGRSDDRLQQERHAALRAGLQGVEMVARAPFDSFDSGPAVRFPRQAQMDPLKYVLGLARSCSRGGVQIHTDTRVVRVVGGARPRVQSREGHVVECRACIVATNSPIGGGAPLHTLQRAFQSYVVGLQLPWKSVPHVLLWDTADPYHYVRLQRLMMAGEQPGWDVLLVGGEDHETGQANDADERYRRLESWARSRFPMCRDVKFRWSGEIMEPLDGAAFIGPGVGAGDNVFVATGDSGDGLTHGAIAGRLLTDLIQGRPSAWSKLYNPSRIPISSAKKWALSNLETAKQYARWLPGGDISSADDLPCGEGAVMQRGLSKAAIYRRPDGTLVERSAACTHLGCVVSWNSGEKTWDCACHGSRFNAEGRVIHGPATADLPVVSGVEEGA